jgi:hypothetical protein
VAYIARTRPLNLHSSYSDFMNLQRSPLQAIISPVYLTCVLGKQAYLRYRVAIIALALLSYTLHSGGGLYQDAVMTRDEQRGGDLAALTLFVRLLVGSCTLFWLVLRCFMKLCALLVWF